MMRGKSFEESKKYDPNNKDADNALKKLK